MFHDFDASRFSPNQQVEVYDITTGVVDDTTILSIEEELADEYVHYSTMENNMLCHMYYAAGEALRRPTDPVAGSPAGRLFLYAYEMILAQEDSNLGANYKWTASDGLGTFGGFSAGGVSGEIAPGDATGVRVLNQHYGSLPYPLYASQYRADVQHTHTFFPQVCAAYAAQRLGADITKLPAHPRRLPPHQLTTSPSTTITTRAQETPRYTKPRFPRRRQTGVGGSPYDREVWPMASPGMAEVQYQLRSGRSPVTLTWNDTTPIVEGQTRNYYQHGWWGSPLPKM